MIRKKLINIQRDLKAPKGQYNSFGKFNYRSCEDILEAVKPLLAREDCILTISDDVIEVGGRIYIKAKATLVAAEDGSQISNTAFARESTDKKGMDESQLTGTASSYARKYCLNGLFLIDDTKDADTDEFRNQQDSQQAKGNAGSAKLTPVQVKATRVLIEKNNLDEAGVLKMYGIGKLEDMTAYQMSDLNAKIEAHKEAKK